MCGSLLPALPDSLEMGTESIAVVAASEVWKMNIWSFSREIRARGEPPAWLRALVSRIAPFPRLQARWSERRSRLSPFSRAPRNPASRAPADRRPETDARLGGQHTRPAAADHRSGREADLQVSRHERHFHERQGQRRAVIDRAEELHTKKHSDTAQLFRQEKLRFLIVGHATRVAYMSSPARAST